jgi:hypothetical protein
VTPLEIDLVTPVDEFCRDAEFEENILNDEKSVTCREIFSFKSAFPKENIVKSLDEILKNTNISSKKIIHRDQLGSRSAVYLYTLELKIKRGKHQKTSFSWPQMSPSQMELFQNLRRIF